MDEPKPINFNAEKTLQILTYREEIGKSIASKRFLNNMDGFWFAVNAIQW